MVGDASKWSVPVSFTSAEKFWWTWCKQEKLSKSADSNGATIAHHHCLWQNSPIKLQQWQICLASLSYYWQHQQGYSSTSICLGYNSTWVYTCNQARMLLEEVLIPGRLSHLPWLHALCSCPTGQSRTWRCQNCMHWCLVLYSINYTRESLKTI